MRKSFKLSTAFVLLLLGLLSCEKSFEPVTTLADSESISISEAKAWFEGIPKNARTAGEEINSQVYWKLAFETKPDKKKENSVVIVPISHGKKGRAYGYKQLWIYKGKDKQNAMRVVEFVDDKDIPREELGKYSFKNFTGAMVVRNWDDEILGAFRWKEGKKATVLKLESVTVDGKQQNLKSSKNGRITGCEFTMNTWGQYVTVNGVEIDRWTEYDGDWNCSWEDLYGWDQAPPGADGGYWSGGGGGGGDSGSVGTFVLSNEDQNKYPKFTQIVKDLYNFVKNNSQVMNALKQWSGLSESQILDKIRFGYGPAIIIKDMTGKYGYFNRYENPNVINIDASWVRGLEAVNDNSRREAIGFLLAVTILHEFVHQARAENGLDRNYEYGFAFENMAFGLIINESNAAEYSYILYQK